MPEMAHTREHHRYASLIRRINDFLIAHRATGLGHAGRARVDHHIKAVAEREEGVAGHGGPLQ